MAKGKKASGSSYTSAGINSNVSRSTLNGMKKDRNPGVKMLNLQKAWLKGLNPWITMENPDKNDTSRRFIRVRMNDTYLGNPKERSKKMYVMV